MRVILIATLTYCAGALAKWDPYCASLMTSDPTPAWTESLKPNVRSSDGNGRWVEFHYENRNPKFINIACTRDSDCGNQLLSEIKQKEPAFWSPHPYLARIISESLKLSEKWDSALSLSWNQEPDTTWSLRLSLDIPPPGKRVLQSENVEIQSDTRIERIDITVSHERITVLYANVPAVEFGSQVISAETGSHGAGVILAHNQEIPGIDAQSLRAEFFHGPMASASLRRSLETALMITKALRPEADRIILQGRRGILAEHSHGQWIWPAIH